MSGQDLPVHELARSGDIQALRALLDRHPQLALAEGWFARLPIHCAAEAGSVECVRLLIQVGAIASSLSYSALVNVCDGLHAWTPLFEAVRSNSLECAALLLEYRANPNARSAEGNRGETPLFHAKSVEMVLLLEKYGADLDAISEANQYVFEASGWQTIELLQFWLNRGVNVDRTPGFQKPLLHSAIGLGELNGGSGDRIERVNLLLNCG